jgi:uncharacterized membrane protein YjjP (DUF1212 family)
MDRPFADASAHMIRASPGSINSLSKLAYVDEIANRVAAGTLDPEQGSYILDKIIKVCTD